MTAAQDPFDLERFVLAQDSGGTYQHAVAELRRGRKTSHWMWFVFPQIAGLGLSDVSRTYAIANLAEARAYLADDVLGSRLRACVETVLLHAGTPPTAIFGSIDALKLRSSLTLFERAGAADDPFARGLDVFFGGVRDAATLDLLDRPKR